MLCGLWWWEGEVAEKINDGGSAFPILHTTDGNWVRGPLGKYAGMSMRDWFATHAPVPTADQLASERAYDKSRNPYNDHYKPKLRSTSEIVADLAYAHADAMLAARARSEKEAG